VVTLNQISESSLLNFIFAVSEVYTARMNLPGK